MKAETWNADSVVTGNSKTTKIHVGWLNFLDSNNEWVRINSNIVDNGSHFGVQGAPFSVQFPKFSDGKAEFINDNRFDVFEKSIITEKPVSMEIIAEGVTRVAGHIETGDLGSGECSYVIYPNAYPFGDLIYYVDHGRAPRLKKLVRFTEAPKQDIEVDFKIRFSDLMNTYQLRNKRKMKMLNDLNTEFGISNKFNGQRGIGLKDFKIWDSGINKVIAPIRVSFSLPIIGGWQTLTKKIPKAFFDNVVYPVFTDTTSTFYPDPDTESTCVDGHVGNTNTVWATARAATTGTISSDSGTSISEDNYLLGGNYGIYRIFVLFDTSAIPDTDTIDSGVLKLKPEILVNDDNDGQDYITVVPTTPASNTAIATGDFDALSFTKQSDDIDHGTMSVGTYVTLTLNSTGKGNVSKTGITKFGIVGGHDFENAASAAGENWFRAYSSEVSGTTSDPYLQITHSASPLLVGIERTPMRGVMRGTMRP